MMELAASESAWADNDQSEVVSAGPCNTPGADVQSANADDNDDMIDLDGDGKISEYEKILGMHFNIGAESGEKFFPQLEVNAVAGFGRMFAAGAPTVRERMISSWENQSIVSSLMVSITLPAILEPPASTTGPFKILFVALISVHLACQLYALTTSIYLITVLHRLPGSVSCVVFLNYPKMMGFIKEAYGLSIDMIWVMVFLILVTLYGQVNWFEDSDKPEWWDDCEKFHVVIPTIAFTWALIEFTRMRWTAMPAAGKAMEMERKIHEKNIFKERRKAEREAASEKLQT